MAAADLMRNNRLIGIDVMGEIQNKDLLEDTWSKSFDLTAFIFGLQKVLHIIWNQRTP